MILHIAARELRSLFYSPLAWSLFAVIHIVLALIFLSLVESYELHQPQLIAMNAPWGVTDLVVNDLFIYTRLLLLVICPLLTMQLLSEEKKSGSFKLLLASPASMTQIVLGKYLGVMGFFIILLLSICLMPLSLLLGTSLDLSKIASALTGLLLLSGAFCALGLYMSSLTQNALIAAASSFGLLLLFAIINNNPAFQLMSTFYHNTPMLKGIINSSNIIYFILFIIYFLILSIRHLDTERLRA